MKNYHIKKNSRLNECDKEAKLKYNISTKGNNEKEVDIMTEFVQKIYKLEIPANTLRQLGLEKDWNKKVSTDFLSKVVTTAEKHKKVLKELSKY